MNTYSKGVNKNIKKITTTKRTLFHLEKLYYFVAFQLKLGAPKTV